MTAPLPRRKRRADDDERFRAAAAGLRASGIYRYKDDRGRTRSACERTDEEPLVDAWLIAHGIDPAEYRHWLALQLLTYPTPKR